MLVFRNYLSCLKRKIPNFNIQSIRLFDDKTDKFGSEVTDNKYDYGDDDDDDIGFPDDQDFTTVETSPKISQKRLVKKSTRNILTPWTMPNLLQPLNLDNLPSRKSNSNEKKSFATLLRHSPLMQLGNCEKFRAVGVIFEIIDKDLYVDFGGKFYCVVENNKSMLVSRGTLVTILVKDVEITSAFMLDKLATTVLEADGFLLNIGVKINKADINELFVT